MAIIRNISSYPVSAGAAGRAFYGAVIWQTLTPSSAGRHAMPGGWAQQSASVWQGSDAMMQPFFGVHILFALP
jgi:hypothetical protein